MTKQDQTVKTELENVKLYWY